MKAAVKGTQRIAVPVVFSTLTTLVAFWPLLQLHAPLGSFLRDIPTVVMIVLSLSMLQAFLILPRNLSGLKIVADSKPNLVFRGLSAVHIVFDHGMKWFIQKPLDAILRFFVQRFPIAGVVALMMLTIGLLSYGYVRFEFFPAIDGEFVTANVEMIDGTTFERTEDVAETLRVAGVRAGERLQKTLPADAPNVLIGQYVVAGLGGCGGGPAGDTAPAAPTLAQVVIEVTKASERSWQTGQFETLVREEVGRIAGVNSLTISSSLVDAGDAIVVELSLPEGRNIAPAMAKLHAGLSNIPSVFQILDDASSEQLG